jgi:hypothetical protein
LITVLSVGVLATGVHYAANHDRHWPYPTGDDIATDYSEQVGQEVLLFGTVRSNDNRKTTIAVSHANGSVTMEVENFDKSVQPGGTVQVFGELQPSQTIKARNVVVVNPTKDSALYKYAVSSVGALLVVGAFLREWRLDTETVSFEVR